MADEKDKKDDKDTEKKDKAPSGLDSTGTLIILGAIALMLIATRINKGVQEGELSGRTVTSYIPAIPEWIREGFKDLAVGYIILVNVLSLFFLIALVYALIKVLQVEKIWHAQIYPEVSPEEEEKLHQKNDRWSQVVMHIGSTNPSDWRLAILEADIVLDELLDQLGYTGDTMGDKLKKVARGDFETIDSAWEAHKIRNAIAHEGQDFELSQREAQRIIGLYQAVFQEFDYI